MRLLLTLIHKAGGIKNVKGMRPIEPTSLHMPHTASVLTLNHLRC